MISNCESIYSGEELKLANNPGHTKKNVTLTIFTVVCLLLLFNPWPLNDPEFIFTPLGLLLILLKIPTAISLVFLLIVNWSLILKKLKDLLQFDNVVDVERDPQELAQQARRDRLSRSGIKTTKLGKVQLSMARKNSKSGNSNQPNNRRVLGQKVKQKASQQNRNRSQALDEPKYQHSNNPSRNNSRNPSRNHSRRNSEDENYQSGGKQQPGRKNAKHQENGNSSQNRKGHQKMIRRDKKTGQTDAFVVPKHKVKVYAQDI